MGNVTCGTEDAFDPADDKVEPFQLTPNAKAFAFDKPDEDNNFLKLHLEERIEKSILDQAEVTRALARQAEAYARRRQEIPSNLSDPYSLHGGDAPGRQPSTKSNASSIKDDRSEVTTGVQSSGYEPSAANTALTNTTTDTAKTAVVGNFDRYSRRKKRKDSIRTPPRILGTDFDPNDSLYDDLESVITTLSKKEEKRAVAMSKGGCGIIPMSLLLEPAFDSSPALGLHMMVLHLRIAPRCASYFQNQLSRFLPDNAFTYALFHGISASPLSPPRRRRGAPPLARTDSDSSSSKSLELDYGEGPQSIPIQLIADDSSFMDLGLTGSLGLVDREKRRLRMDKGRKFLKPPDHYIVVLNRRSGAPLAVCALKAATNGAPIVRIYATKRRTFGQRPASSTRNLGLDWTDSLPLFPWAEIVTKGRYPNRVRYAIYMASGNDGRFEEIPSYHALHSSAGSPEIRVIGKTEREKTHSGCAVLCLNREEDANADEEFFFRLSIAKGIDPALLICFAAFVDEMMEKTMRTMCTSVNENIYRGVSSASVSGDEK